MARIRTVKPEFWQHPKVTAVSRDARLCFIGLLNEADDAGRMRYSAKRLSGVLFGEDEDVTAKRFDRWVDELERVGLIVRYESEGAPLLSVIGFTEHQRINRPTDSSLPEPSMNGHVPLTESSLSPHGGKGKERKGKEQGVENGADKPPPVVRIFEAWKESTGRHRSHLDSKRRRVIENALKTYEPDDLIDAVRGWKHSAHNRGENERSTVYNDIELLLRDAAHIERFRDLERQHDVATSSAPAVGCALGICDGDGLIADESSATGFVDCPCRSPVEDRPMEFSNAR